MNKTEASSEEKRALVTDPGDHDVLLGRGGGTNVHKGNIKFRELVNEHKQRYLASSKVEKPKVGREVVEIWRKLDPPGRFLQKISDGKSKASIWEEVPFKKAREKASQCLRERTTDVAPYPNQFYQKQDQVTEKVLGMIGQKMNGQLNGTALKTPDQNLSSASIKTQMIPRVGSMQGEQQPQQSEFHLQQLYARQQQNLRETYIADTPHSLQQNAIAMARQQTLQEQRVLEHQAQLLLQQQMAMEEQFLKNNILAQQLMVQRNGFAMAQGMPAPVPNATRRTSLSTGFSQMDINGNPLSPYQGNPLSPQQAQNGLMHNNPSLAAKLLVNNIMGGGLPLNNMTQQNIQPQETVSLQNNNHVSISPIPLSRDLRSSDLDSTPFRENPIVTQETPPKLKQETQETPKASGSRKRSSTKKKAVPFIIATNSNDKDEAGNLSSKDKNENNRKIGGSELHDSGNISQFGEYGEDFQTALNDAEDGDFDEDNSSEEMLKDHSTLQMSPHSAGSMLKDHSTLQMSTHSAGSMLKDHSTLQMSTHSAGSGELSFNRTRTGRRSRRNSKTSLMAMSISSSLLSVSAMDFSAAEECSSGETKMNSSRSLASQRSLMSELTDYEDLIL